MTLRIAIFGLAGMAASLFSGFCWRLARRAQAGRKRRLRQLEMELRLAHASEAFHQEVFRLKHSSRVLRPNLKKQDKALILSTKVSSLRYIKGRENDD